VTGYRAIITDRRSGESVVVTFDDPWVDADGCDREYWWTEGNYGCDCNRYLEFERAQGRDPEFEDAKCLYPDFPDGHRFTARIESLDGELLLVDP
jgi:hypothetical protein